ncbi:MAG: cytidine deaminase [Lachnospiraceae bacterium]|nr:cytidine deaminase [Lachnospiraceae bacterium]
MNDVNKLINMAFEVREKAYIPYSNHGVGAALLSKDGEIFTGCNVENAAYSPTNCAERTAFFKAVSEGVREFEAIAIVGGLMNRTATNICAPCGVCRQVMREFCSDDFKIYLGYRNEAGDIDYELMTLGELLPESFGPENL